MNKLVTTLLAGSLAFTGINLAQADEATGGPGHQHAMACQHGRADYERGDRLERMQRHLNLSEAQVKQIGDIFAKASADSQPLRQTMRETRQQLRTLMQADNPEEAKIRTLAESQGRVQADLIVLRSKTHAAINQVLTPEQRQKMQAGFRRHQHHDVDTDSQS